MKKYGLFLALCCSGCFSLNAMHSCKRFVAVCLSAGKSQAYSKKAQCIDGLRQLPQNVSLQELEEFHAHPTSDDAKLFFLKTGGYEKVVKKLINEEFHRCRESGRAPSQMVYDMHRLLHPTLEDMKERFHQACRDSGEDDSHLDDVPDFFEDPAWRDFLATNGDPLCDDIMETMHKRTTSKCYSDCDCKESCEECHDRNEGEE